MFRNTGHQWAAIPFLSHRTSFLQGFGVKKSVFCLFCSSMSRIINLYPTNVICHLLDLSARRPENLSFDTAHNQNITFRRVSFILKRRFALPAYIPYQGHRSESLNNCKKRLPVSSGLSVRPSTCSNSAPTGPNAMNFNVVFENLIEKIQVSLKSNNNNRYFTWRPIYIYGNISLSSS